MSEAAISVIEAVVVIVNSTVATAMNLMLFFLVYEDRRLRTVFNFFILNLSFADILVSVNMVITMALNLSSPDQIRENPGCTVSGFVNILCFVASVMALAAVSINRYYLVVHWQTYHVRFSRKRAVGYIAVVWILSIALVVPPLIGWGRYGYHEDKSICFVIWGASISYMVFMVGMCFMGPISATLVSVICIIKHRRQLQKTLGDKKDISKTQRNSIKSGDTKLVSAVQSEKITKEEYKITLSVIIIVSLFIVSWGPFVIVMFLNAVGKVDVPRWVEFSSIVLGCMNSTGNPIVYLILNKNFRNATRRRFCKNRVAVSSNDNYATRKKKSENSNFTVYN
uniref:Biogenic amine-like GPCR n=1 Tax=Tripedalia cystophora TaxID=6141 RepID=A0A4D5XWB7_TRICY|nr:biogenic amine-like GPCR [Tripedalia cystophora]